MEETIVVGSKNFKVRELLAIELDEVLDIVDKKESLKKQVCLSTELSSEEYSKLTVKERIAIIKVINRLNGSDDDFQKSSSEESKK